jgi:hypothetical protein
VLEGMVTRTGLPVVTRPAADGTDDQVEELLVETVERSPAAAAASLLFRR